eukprot:gene29261-12504_t
MLLRGERFPAVGGDGLPAEEALDLARSPMMDIAGGSPPVQYSAESRRKRKPLSKLQPGRRPTCAAAWLGGTDIADRLAPQVGAQVMALEHAAAAALGAIGHTPAALYHTAHSISETIPETMPASGHVFRSSQGQAAVEAEEESSRMARNIRKKLQQIAALSAVHDGGVALDMQQMAKLGQRLPLLEALQALEANAPLEEVNQMLAHAQEVAAKWVVANPSASSLPDSSSRQLSEGRQGSESHRQGGTPNSGKPKAAKKKKQQDEEQMSALAAAASSSAMSMGEAQPALLAHLGGGAQPPSIVGFDPTNAGPSWRSSPGPIAAAAGAEWKWSASKMDSNDRGSGPHPASAVPPMLANSSSSTAVGGAAPPSKASARKGGLSQFLAGVLDKRQPPPVEKVKEKVPQPPKQVWGGLPVASTNASSSNPAPGSAVGQDPTTPSDPSGGDDSRWLVLGGKGDKGGGGSKSSISASAPKATAGGALASKPAATSVGAGSGLFLGDFVVQRKPTVSKPVDMAGSSPVSKALPWGGGGGGGATPSSSNAPQNPKGKGTNSATPPPMTLKDIQEEQQRLRACTKFQKGKGSGGGGVPGGVTAVTSGSSHVYGSSPPDSGNKWYVPDQIRPQQLQFIQTETTAIQEIAKLYGKNATVSIVHADGVRSLLPLALPVPDAAAALAAGEDKKPAASTPGRPSKRGGLGKENPGSKGGQAKGGQGQEGGQKQGLRAGEGGGENQRQGSQAGGGGGSGAGGGWA